MNNPVNMTDENGHWPKWLENAASAVGNFTVKVVNALAGSFQAEGGVGVGLGASASVGPIKASVSAYQDGLTIGLKNGSTYTSIKGSAGISAQVTKKASLGISTEYEHRFETAGIQDWDDHTTMSMPWSVYNCPKTVKDPWQFSFPIIKPVEGNLSSGLFIGISGEAHLGIGGHFSIGFDVNEFIKVFNEQ